MSEKELLINQEYLLKYFFYDSNTGVMQRTKYGNGSGFYDRKGYLCFKIKDKTFGIHRLAWLYTFGKWPTGHIDHINGVRDDNRIANLRDVDRRTNNQNTNHHRNGRLVGTSLRSNGKYQAKITIDKTMRYLGSFDTESEAHTAYMDALARIKAGKNAL